MDSPARDAHDQAWVDATFNAAAERDAYWGVLTEIAFANFEEGPTPYYIREHARRALKMEPFPVCQESDDDGTL